MYNVQSKNIHYVVESSPPSTDGSAKCLVRYNVHLVP